MKYYLFHIKYFLIVFWHNLIYHIKTTWRTYTLMFFIIFIFYDKNIHFEFQLKNNYLNFSTHESSKKNDQDTTGITKKTVSGIKRKDEPIQLVSFKDEDVQEKRYKNYIYRHSEYAVEEMRKNKIPASITLAQGLLETNGGKSKLATKNNNHFGIKCFSKTCKKGHCSNFNDDSHKDFFRIYSSTKSSYEAHSYFLKKKRYKKLFYLNPKDYKGWAKELKKAGYATDKKYDKKLIALIQKYKLHQFDE